MFRVTNTKNLLGVTIHGDYDDLNDLYDAIYHISTYYYEKQAGYYDRIRNDRPDLEKQMTHEIEIQEARHNCVLGLCYDIRHAYMGDRNYELIPTSFNHEKWFWPDTEPDPETDDADTIRLKNKINRLAKETQYGNLQFSVEIFYPWILFYIHEFVNYTQDLYDSDFDMTDVQFEFEFYNETYKNDRIHIVKDYGLLMNFTAKLCELLRQTIGKENADLFFQYAEGLSEFSTSTLYPEALCDWYTVLKNKKAAPEVMQSAILFMAYEIFSPESFHKDARRYLDEEEKALFDKAFSAHDQAKQIIDPVYKTISFRQFDRSLHRFLSKKDHFYESDFDEFLEKKFHNKDQDWDVFETNPWPEGYESRSR